MKPVFIPLREEFKPAPHTIYISIFRLGVFKFTLQLIDSRYSNLSEKDKFALRREQKKLAGRYVSVLVIEKVGWIWSTNDDLTLAEMDYKEKMNALKAGDSVEFTDISNLKQPVRISYKGIEFIW